MLVFRQPMGGDGVGAGGEVWVDEGDGLAVEEVRHVPGFQPLDFCWFRTQGFALGCYVSGFQPFGFCRFGTQGFALGCSVSGFQPLDFCWFGTQGFALGCYVSGFQPFGSACSVPREPDVSESLAAGGFADALFEGEALADRVGRGGVLLAEHLAEIEKVGLGAGAL